MNPVTIDSRTSAQCAGTVQVSAANFTANSCVDMTAEAPQFSENNSVITYTPKGAFAASSTYEIRLSSAIKDFAGNSLDDQTITFTTPSAASAAAPAYVDISAGQGIGSGTNPSIALHNNKLYVAARNDADNGKPGLTICDADGTDCTFHDISVGQGTNSGTSPQLVVDTTNAKVLVVTTNAANGNKVSLFRCELDATACTHTDISTGAGQGNDTGLVPTVAIDYKNARLLIVTHNTANSGHPSLFSCTLTDTAGTSCSHTELWTGANSGRKPKLVLDTVNDRMLVVTYNAVTSGKPFLIRCNLDGTGCAGTDISASQGNESGFIVTAAIDTVNNRLLVATENGALGQRSSIFRCALDGSACTHFNVSNLAGFDNPFSGWRPSIMLDLANDAVFVATQNGASNSRPMLFRCNLNVAGCTNTDWSAGQAASSGRFPQLVLDGLTGSVLMVTQNGANGERLALFHN